MSEAKCRVDTTPLNTTVKIRFPHTLDARSKLYTRQLEPACGDDPFAAFLRQLEGPLTYQKTNLVVKTVGEAEALLYAMYSFSDCGGPHGRTWATAAHERAYARGVRDLREALEATGHEVTRIDRFGRHRVSKE